MKKKILVCALVAICLSIVAYGTAAYFTYEDTATNVITAGNVRIEIEELAYSSITGGLVPFTDPINVVPGTSESKIVRVKNTGFATAWIRLSLEKTIILAEGREGEIDLSLVTYNINEKYWAEKDGWFYYLSPLEPGETTEPIFTDVSFASSMGNMYQQSKSIIDVIAHATQTVHNGENVFEAAGWPAEK